MKGLIYAVDDELSIRELYACVLESADYDVCCYEDYDGLKQGLKLKKPDLFLLDIMLDKMSGYDILQELKQNALYKDVPVIMVSALGEEISKVKGLNLGADDYMSKPFGVMELIARINAKLRKMTVKELCFKDIIVSKETHKININGKNIKLSLKLFELLCLLIDNCNKVCSREKIFNSVWGYDFEGESRTLDMHVKELRKILELYNSDAVIETVRGVGYLIK